MLEKTLHKMVDEQLAKWLLSRILDVAQLEMQAIDISITVGKRNNPVVVLHTESETEERGYVLQSNSHPDQHQIRNYPMRRANRSAT